MSYSEPIAWDDIEATSGHAVTPSSIRASCFVPPPGLLTRARARPSRLVFRKSYPADTLTLNEPGSTIRLKRSLEALMSMNGVRYEELEEDESRMRRTGKACKLVSGFKVVCLFFRSLKYDQ